MEEKIEKKAELKNRIINFYNINKVKIYIFIFIIIIAIVSVFFIKNNAQKKKYVNFGKIY